MRYLIFILSMIFLGCAELSVNLKDSEIRPFKEFSKIEGASEALGPIKFEVIDARGEARMNQIGFAYTGVQYQKTPVLLKKDVAAYTKDELATAFTRRNVLVSDEAEIAFEMIITKLSVNEYIEKHMPERAVCEIELQVKSQYLAKTFNARYWTEITSPGDLGDGTEKIAPTFASCLNVIANKIATDPKFQAYLK